MQLINVGHGTLKIVHPTSIADMLIKAGAVDEMAQAWRLILRGFDPLTFGCADGYVKFRAAKYPYTNGGEEYDKRYNPNY